MSVIPSPFCTNTGVLVGTSKRFEKDTHFLLPREDFYAKSPLPILRELSTEWTGGAKGAEGG